MRRKTARWKYSTFSGGFAREFALSSKISAKTAGMHLPDDFARVWMNWNGFEGAALEHPLKGQVP